MAKMYHALVLMSGGLAGCAGSNQTDDVATQTADGANPMGVDDESTDDPTTTAMSSADSTSAGSEPSPGGARPTEAESSGDEPTPGAPDSSAAATDSTASDPNANGNATPTDPDSSSDEPAPSAPDSSATPTPIEAEPNTDPTPPDDPDPGIIISDPAPSVGTLLDGCPPEQQQCEVRSCFTGSAGVCGDAEFCSLEPEGPCSCGPAQSLDCAEGEVLTCLLGRFPAGDAGITEQRFDCRCLPRQDNCEDLCAEMENAGGGRQRACVEQEGVVLCGGCILAGILR